MIYNLLSQSGSNIPANAPQQVNTPLIYGIFLLALIIFTAIMIFIITYKSTLQKKNKIIITISTIILAIIFFIGIFILCKQVYY